MSIEREAWHKECLLLGERGQLRGYAVEIDPLPDNKYRVLFQVTSPQPYEGWRAFIEWSADPEALDSFHLPETLPGSMVDFVDNYLQEDRPVAFTGSPKKILQDRQEIIFLGESWEPA